MELHVPEPSPGFTTRLTKFKLLLANETSETTVYEFIESG